MEEESEFENDVFVAYDHLLLEHLKEEEITDIELYLNLLQEAKKAIHRLQKTKMDKILDVDIAAKLVFVSQLLISSLYEA